MSETQRDRLLALLADFGIEPAVAGTVRRGAFHVAEGEEVLLEAHHGNVDGYSGFFARFEFDEAGKFESLSVWE